MSTKSRHIGTVHAFGHEVRVVWGNFDVYAPTLTLYLKGPNGSACGFGPKGWPKPLARVLRNRRLSVSAWSESLEIPVPWLSWARAYKLRKLGALKLYALQGKLYAWTL